MPDGSPLTVVPAAEPAYPTWLLERLRPHAEYLRGLTPFPFDQPADISGYLSFHQNDYLRLANHPEVVNARALANGGRRVESFSSSVFGGASPEHDEFMDLLRASLQADVVLTTAGWTANVGLIDAIATSTTPVYLDCEAHASLDDGIRLARAAHVMLRHNDPDAFARRVRIHGPGILCIDAVYSTTGSVPDVRRYVEIAEQHDCVLLLDEAHSFGMFGANGGGLAVALDLAHRVHFRTVSLSKALGGHGGVIAAAPAMMAAITASLRPVVFSSATSAVLAAGHAAALRLVMREPQRAAHCLTMAARLARHFEAAGLDTRGSASQIVSVFFDDDASACQLYARLRDANILTSVFVYPAVERGKALVRFSVYSDVTEEQIDDTAARAIDAVADLPVVRRRR